MSLKNLNANKTLKTLKIKLSNKKILKLFNIFEKDFNVKKAFVVGVSGGPDSLALAFFSKLYSIKHKLKCKYLIVDHKLRKESTNEAKKVKKILNIIGVKAEILTWNGKKPTKNIQSISRKKRYELLFSKCKKFKITNLVTGHHIDDLFENFFIRMIRGSGLKGLISFKKYKQFNSINLIRPLLNFEKKDLEFVSRLVFGFFVEDPSNENINYQRIKIRKMINHFKNNGFDKNKLFLTLKNLKKSDQAILFYVEQNKGLNSFFNKKNKDLILNNNFFNHPHEVVFRSLSDSIKKIGNKDNFTRGKKIDHILNKIKKNSLKKETLGGCVIKKVNQTIIITKES
tara:strand:- start:174 stop:1199 length:1026 start_codon:yes stop_codon:yes gene_type:complete